MKGILIFFLISLLLTLLGASSGEQTLSNSETEGGNSDGQSSQGDQGGDSQGEQQGESKKGQNGPSTGKPLVLNFYHQTCPEAEAIVQSIIWGKVSANSSLPPKFLRLHFHDCFVRGCDASVLIESTSSNKAEKDAIPNLTLDGFAIINEVKDALENKCKGVVSCADIVALAARDAVSFQFKRPLWKVPTGRRDGTISLASEADAQIPSPFFDFATLQQSFASKNFTVHDLVVLSGY